jgi:uncharacterized protein YcbK (DUF882 family)
MHSHFGSLYGAVKVGINSGYRCEARNRKVGGSSGSSHLTGRAVDFVVYRKVGEEWQALSTAEVVNYLDSVALGKWGVGFYNSWTHLDTRSGKAARWNG